MSSSASDKDIVLPKKSRALVLCFDGTDGQYDNNNTNVVKFFSLLKKDDFHEQLCYYQAGIGTYFDPGIVSPFLQWWAKILDEAVAWYLDAHVMDGYKFLMENYRVGDKICLFGFSRGAYTARALAGMLSKVGLLPKDNSQQVSFAYKLYTRTDKAGIKLCAGFKQTFSQCVNIDFVGVWETVASVGIVAGRNLPFVDTNTAIKTFRHALSLDEHRAKFRPNLYHRPAPNKKAAAKDPEHASSVDNRLAASGTHQAQIEVENNHDSKKPELIPSFGRKSAKRKAETCSIDGKASIPVATSAQEPEEGATTDVLEVWFSGCHSDVGGGAVTDDTALCLSQITLRWMVREVMASQCGIQFEDEALLRLNIPTTFFPPQSSGPVNAGDPELELDQQDALQPLHDDLKLNILWWLLEIIPTNYTYQDADCVWHSKWSFHLGAGRRLYEYHPHFHVTVRERMADTVLKYKPKAVWKAGNEVYVE